MYFLLNSYGFNFSQEVMDFVFSDFQNQRLAMVQRLLLQLLLLCCVVGVFGSSLLNRHREHLKCFFTKRWIILRILLFVKSKGNFPNSFHAEALSLSLIPIFSSFTVSLQCWFDDRVREFAPGQRRTSASSSSWIFKLGFSVLRVLPCI